MAKSTAAGPDNSVGFEPGSAFPVQLAKAVEPLEPHPQCELLRLIIVLV